MLRATFGLYPLSLIALSVCAHPGGVDSQGGHTDSRTGEYHSHAKAEPIQTTLEGTVTAVQDGDTLTLSSGLQSNLRIRLEGIDAPESNQPFGDQSKRKLADLVLGQSVRVEVVTTDRYGRTVGRVFKGDDDVCLLMVRTGHAWWYRRYAEDDKVLSRAESFARRKGVGLWADEEAVAPWDFR